jgi:hypothetical protein
MNFRRSALTPLAPEVANLHTVKVSSRCKQDRKLAGVLAASDRGGAKILTSNQFRSFHILV